MTKRSAPSSDRAARADLERCVVCGSTDLREIRCKVVCGNCGTVLKTCADS